MTANDFTRELTAVFNRRGVIGTPSTWAPSIDVDTAAYRRLRRAGVATAHRDDTSIDALNCECGGRLAVVDPVSTAISEFTDTFSENIERDYVTVTVVCDDYPAECRRYPGVLRGTVAELLCDIRDVLYAD